MTGKGDKPRNCFSKKFKDNFSEIVWKAGKGKKHKKNSCNTSKKTIKYY